MNVTMGMVDGEWVVTKVNKDNMIPECVELKNEWCECGADSEFGCYPNDGECTCGVIKHHVHCTCGKICQIG